MEIQRSAERYQADHGWLKTAHSFSFADYFDPERLQWGALRVFNDDTIAGGSGFPTHPHRDMDIVTYVLDGELEHRDSMGNHGVVQRYGVQYMSAGTGVRHSEVNASADKPLHLVQMWVLPQHAGIKPAYGQQSFTPADVHDKWLTIASGEADVDARIRLDADATFSAAEIDAGTELRHTTKANRRAFLFVAEGAPDITVSGASAAQQLKPGDAVRIEPGEEIVLRGPAHVVLWDVDGAQEAA
jgi:redox-sensitive bicupin YhaK (pirin superfamily)